ncbi:hypothetical protein D3C85_1757240 [compost metagenome]
MLDDLAHRRDWQRVDQEDLLRAGGTFGNVIEGVLAQLVNAGQAALAQLHEDNRQLAGIFVGHTDGGRQ